MSTEPGAEHCGCVVTNRKRGCIRKMAPKAGKIGVAKRVHETEDESSDSDVVICERKSKKRTKSAQEPSKNIKLITTRIFRLSPSARKVDFMHSARHAQASRICSSKVLLIFSLGLRKFGFFGLQTTLGHFRGNQLWERDQ